jgi:L-rhamnose isomerase
MLEPTTKLRSFEENGHWFERLALLEEAKTKPFGAVWDYYCLEKNVAVAEDYISEVADYEDKVLSKRG